MFRYFLRRLVHMIPVLIVVSMIAFSILYILPGDPALALLGEDLAGDRELYEQLREDLGLNDPLPVQYWNWISGVLQGDMGHSLRTRESVLHVIFQRLGPTLLLGFYATLLSIAIGVPAGVVSALRPNSKLDMTGTVGAIMGASIPNFWLAILLILVFAIWLPWLPIGGYVSPIDDPLGHARFMIMPTIALGTAVAALVMRQTRSAVLEVIREDYVKTARAKGLSETVVIFRHTLKNAMIPVVTVIGLQTGTLMGGAVVTETIFSVPGIGRLAVTSINIRDFPVLQGVILVMALFVMLANLAADVTYAWLDPRIRY